MAAGDSWDSWLITGLAEHLADHGLGVWRPDGTAYQPDEVAISDRGIIPQPDRLIVLTDYIVPGQPDGLADMLIGVQIRLRGTTDPRVVRDLGSEIYDLLDSSGRQVWGQPGREVHVTDVWRQSYTQLGADQRGRWEASHNYYVTAMRPTAYRNE